MLPFVAAESRRRTDGGRLMTAADPAATIIFARREEVMTSDSNPAIWE